MNLRCYNCNTSLNCCGEYDQECINHIESLPGRLFCSPGCELEYSGLTDQDLADIKEQYKLTGGREDD